MKADRKAELELKRQENRSKNLSPSCHSVDASLAFAAALVRIFPMRIRNAGAKNGSSRTRLPLQLRQSRYSVVERNTCYDVMHVSASCGFHFLQELTLQQRELAKQNPQAREWTAYRSCGRLCSALLRSCELR